VTAPVRVTVFPRLDCCVPDFTGKNALLAQVLREAKARLGDQAIIEVVPAATRPERLIYYQGMVDALGAAGHALAFARNAEEWSELRRELDALRAGIDPGPATMARLRQVSVSLFMVPPVTAINGRAVFLSDVPSVEELTAAVTSAAPDQEEDNE